MPSRSASSRARGGARHRHDTSRHTRCSPVANRGSRPGRPFSTSRRMRWRGRRVSESLMCRRYRPLGSSCIEQPTCKMRSTRYTLSAHPIESLICCFCICSAPILVDALVLGTRTRILHVCGNRRESRERPLLMSSVSLSFELLSSGIFREMEYKSREASPQALVHCTVYSYRVSASLVYLYRR